MLRTKTLNGELLGKKLQTVEQETKEEESEETEISIPMSINENKDFEQIKWVLSSMISFSYYIIKTVHNSCENYPLNF